MKKIVVYDEKGKHPERYQKLCQSLHQEMNIDQDTMSGFLCRDDIGSVEKIYLVYEEYSESLEAFLQSSKLLHKALYPITFRQDLSGLDAMMEIAQIAVGVRVYPCQCFTETEEQNHYFHMKQWIQET